MVSLCAVTTNLGDDWWFYPSCQFASQVDDVNIRTLDGPYAFVSHSNHLGRIAAGG